MRPIVATVIVLLAAPAPSFAQYAPNAPGFKPVPGAYQLTPGVWTTPEITRRCQAIVRRQMGSAVGDNTAYQARALACARKSYAEKYQKTPR